MKEVLEAVKRVDPRPDEAATQVEDGRVIARSPASADAKDLAIEIVGGESVKSTEQGAVFRGDDADFVARGVRQGTQILAVHKGPERGETSLRFKFPGATLQALPDGHVVIVDGATEQARGVILPAWARDANGATVPTSYAVEKDTLVQTVIIGAEHVFPVVSDPEVHTYWWGVSVDFTKKETQQIAFGGTACATAVGAAGLPGKVVAAFCGTYSVFAQWAMADGKCVSSRFVTGVVNFFPWMRKCSA